jgi:hypothetical protein
VRCFVLAALLAGCGTTGSALVSFVAQAGGPADIGDGAFVTSAGYTVTLTKATLHIGAVYFDESVVSSGMQETACELPTTDVYNGEALGPLDVDLLSATPVAFPTSGSGLQTLARTGQVWLTGGPVDAQDDPQIILAIAGSALRAPTETQAGADVPFFANVTIGTNRNISVQLPSEPGSNPICEQRIVSPIPVSFTPTNNGTLTLRADPRAIVDALDFADVQAIGGTPPYEIPDTPYGPQNIGQKLFSGLHAGTTVYDFSFTPSTNTP